MKHKLLFGFIVYLLAISLAVTAAITDRIELIIVVIALIILGFTIWNKTEIT